jgi:hypothetical protein
MITGGSIPELQAKNAHYTGSLKRLGPNGPKTKEENDYSFEEI